MGPVFGRGPSCMPAPALGQGHLRARARTRVGSGPSLFRRYFFSTASFTAPIVFSTMFGLSVVP
jgi:hypothetical protein